MSNTWRAAFKFVDLWQTFSINKGRASTDTPYSLKKSWVRAVRALLAFFWGIAAVLRDEAVLTFGSCELVLNSQYHCLIVLKEFAGSSRVAAVRAPMATNRSLILRQTCTGVSKDMNSTTFPRSNRKEHKSEWKENERNVNEIEIMTRKEC